MKIIERIVNLETGATSDIERELTQDEIKEIENKRAAREAKVLSDEQNATTKAAVLAKLGLTADEVAALLG